MPLAMASSYHGHYPQTTQMSKSDLRKSNKPIMEKRRRARINTCLNELKTLILDAMKKDPARHSKLEKADILEMTVKHLQEIQREEMRSAVAADPSVISKFHSGFSECATEVSRYISHLDGVEDGVKRRLLGHLNGCVSGMNQVLPLATANPSSSEDVNNNTGAAAAAAAQRLLGAGGLQLVPSRLPTGELAILLPSSSTTTPLTTPTYFNVREEPESRQPEQPLQHCPRSAFRSVARPTPPTSPSDFSDDHRVSSTSPDHPQPPNLNVQSPPSPPHVAKSMQSRSAPSSPEPPHQGLPTTSRSDMWRPW